MKEVMAQAIIVLSIGTKVIIGTDIEAEIVGVWIRREGFVQYDIAWWVECQRHNMWLSREEIRPVEEKESMHVGFK